MARTGGDLTKKKILTTAEAIFSEKGYDGTSIQDISAAAGVNKALIYYHFKNKQDIIDSLFKETLKEMFQMQDNPDNHHLEQKHCDPNPLERIPKIISILEKKKKILTVMFMEALKNEHSGSSSLFKCADIIISRNIKEMFPKLKDTNGVAISREELLMHEFFTGFLPIVFFALFKDKWADFFKCDRKEMMSLFTKIFVKSHIQHE